LFFYVSYDLGRELLRYCWAFVVNTPLLFLGSVFSGLLCSFGSLL
jgi:hypothetical protein